MSNSNLYPWLPAAVENNGVIVTASRRLARELRQHENSRHAAAGDTAWETPPVHSLQAWLVSMLDSQQTGMSQPYRLSSQSELLLWEQCLTASLTEHMRNFAGFVRLARDTWKRMREWEITIEQALSSADHGDEWLFARAADSYRKCLEDKGWTDSAAMPHLLAERIRGSAVNVPRGVTLVGFDRLTPALESLVTALEGAGCSVRRLSSADPAANLQLASFSDAEAELRAAGAWAREILARAPGKRVGIVSGELERDSQGALRLVLEGFAPGWQYGGPRYRSVVDVSYGQRLAEYPAIAYALSCLRWTSTGLHSRELSGLLRSSNGEPGCAGRSRMELKLRRMPARDWTPAQLLSCLQGYDESPDATAWLQSVRSIAEFQGQCPGSAGPAQWAEHFDGLLTLIGWPGAWPLTSDEFQLVNRWRKLLNEYAASDSVVSQVTLHDAVRHIASMAAEAIFQPERDAESLPLLGALEAAGLEFDALWVTGLDATRWPPASSPLPLLSRQLQREHRMPDHDPNDTLEFSRRVLRRLVASAAKVRLSWSRTSKDSEQTASALLSAIDAVESSELEDPGWHAAQFRESLSLDTIAEDAAPAVTAGEKIRGGAYTVSQQHTEPFAAFANGRLGIRELHRFEAGIPARLRGTIVHEALHRLYAGHPVSGDIAAWSEQDVRRRIDTAAAQAVDEYSRHLDGTHRLLFDIEQERLCALLGGFLAAEQGRESFRVEVLECELELDRGNVHLDLKIDRVDVLADGSYLIADYKTGDIKSPLSRGGEIADLQLVVYSLAWDGEIGGVAFINVDRYGVVYRGTGSSTEWHRPKDSDWGDRLEEAQARANAAIEGIAAGDVRINTLLGSEDSRALALLSRCEEVRRGG